MRRTIFVTGGAGFIGSGFVRYVLKTQPDVQVVVFDKLTYAGNLENLTPVSDDARFRFVRGDICDAEAVRAAMQGCDAVVNFAAETHVDRSIIEPGAFVKTDVEGTYTLLEAPRRARRDDSSPARRERAPDNAALPPRPPHYATDARRAIWVVWVFGSHA